jgi:hypothetical protein
MPEEAAATRCTQTVTGDRMGEIPNPTARGILMKKKQRATMQTLVGVITPYAWDENDQVAEVSLSATDDEEYIIQNGDRFLDLVQQPIKAVGMVQSGKKMHRTITIKKFEKIDHTDLSA